MNALLRSLVLVGSLLACQPVSPGPFTSVLALEKWHRSAPATTFVGTGLITFHQADQVPRWVDLDANCGGHFGNWAQSPYSVPSFGSITMTVSNGAPLPWTPDEEGAGWGGPVEGTSEPWGTGDVLKVTASGADAPGFTVEAVVPEKVELTSHALGALAENELTLSRSAPLELRWEPASGEVVLLFMQFPSLDSLHKDVGIWCSFPAAPGGVTVPAAVMERLRPSTPGLSTNIYFGGGATLRREVEGLDLRVFTFQNEAARIQIE